MYILTALLDSSLLRCTMYILKVDTVYHQREKRVNPKSIVITGGATGLGWGIVDVLVRKGLSPQRIGEVVTRPWPSQNLKLVILSSSRNLRTGLCRCTFRNGFSNVSSASNSASFLNRFPLKRSVLLVVPLRPFASLSN